MLEELAITFLWMSAQTCSAFHDYHRGKPSFNRTIIRCESHLRDTCARQARVRDEPVLFMADVNREIKRAVFLLIILKN